MSQANPETRAWLEEKLTAAVSALNMDIQVSVEQEDDNLRLNMTGPDSDYFLGHKAEPLKSMSYLLQTAYDKKNPDADLLIKVDANHQLKNREQELEAMVKQACEGLTQAGQKAELEPLNPYDRRLVHLILQDDDTFKTHSEGVGHYKNVVIERTGE